MTQDNPEEVPSEQPQPGISRGMLVALVILVVALVLIFLNLLGIFPRSEQEVEEVTESFITINQPAEDAVLDIANPITVSGTAGGLFEGSLVVQVLDLAGNVLAEQPTTINAPDAGTGGEGPWSVQLTVDVPPGTPAMVKAFASSPEDEQTIAESSIQVTLGTPVKPYIRIEQPVASAILDISAPFTVNGMAGNLFEGNVVVEALDQAGNVLAQQPTTIDSPQAGIGGQGPWSVQLSVNVSSGVPGTIKAYSTSPEDGSVVVEDSIEVTYGKPVSTEPYIQIEAPTSGTVLEISGPFAINGMGGALFEGNVVVQALDQSGNVLAEQPTIVQSPDAGTGGEGPWTVELSVNVAPGTPGTIRAYSDSPADGSIIAEDSVQVIFGTAEESERMVRLEEHLWVLVSYDGNQVIPGIPVYADFSRNQVNGSAGCNNYFADYQTSDGSLTIGAPGSTRKFCGDPAGLMDQENSYLGLLQQSASYEIQNGQLLISDSSGNLILVYNAGVTGIVSAPAGSELPPGSQATIQLSDVSLADAPAVAISQQVIENPSQFPFLFLVTYDPQLIEQRNTYAIGVRITDSSGNLIYINTTAYNVITRDNPFVIEVMVEEVQ